MRYSCSGVHLSRTGSRISNGTPPTSAIAERAERHCRGGITLFVHVHAQLQTVDTFLFNSTKSRWVEFRQGPQMSRYWLSKTVETFCCTFILCCELWSPGTYTDHHSEWRAKQEHLQGYEIAPTLFINSGKVIRVIVKGKRNWTSQYTKTNPDLKLYWLQNLFCSKVGPDLHC